MPARPAAAVPGRDAADGAMITSFGKYDLAPFKVWTGQLEGAHSERDLRDLLRTRPDSPALTLAPPIGSQR